MDPVLPFELERHIFELAALSCPACIPRLVLVAWRVKDWVEPLLYRTLVLYHHDREKESAMPHFGQGTFARILESKSMEFLCANVQNIFVRDLDRRATKIIKDEFPHLRNLFLMSFDSVDPSMCTNWQLLRHLYCDIQAIFGEDVSFAHPIFSNLTHLELFDGLPEDDVGLELSISDLASLPCLTHIALDLVESRPLRKLLDVPLTETRIRTVVALCTNSVQVSPIAERLREAGLDAIPRLVLMALPRFLHDWLRGIISGDDYWARADMLISKRMSGEVDLTAFILEESSV
ncbi:hypothetical protein C8F01DRAFT_1372381 [Mycena amicta]|nr:hypothetical protein C8F01DRAFT_1372381 [Mycena amicta]